jgi:hypothetical protein
VVVIKVTEPGSSPSPLAPVERSGVR